MTFRNGPLIRFEDGPVVPVACHDDGKLSGRGDGGPFAALALPQAPRLPAGTATV